MPDRLHGVAIGAHLPEVVFAALTFGGFQGLSKDDGIRDAGTPRPGYRLPV